MRTTSNLFLLCLPLLLFIKIAVEVDGKLTLDEPYDSDFNFHNKTVFLKDRIKELIDCIQPNSTSDQLPKEETLLKSTEGSSSGKERFVFEYIGKREYNETCLGDSYKKDFIRRLYDAICMNYTEKVYFLELLSCNATQNLECRQVGVESVRQFAEQATPIMRCLCPDYNKSQAYLSDTSVGYFDKNRQQCVLKAGQKCKIQPKPLDQRLVWNDFDYAENQDDKPTGIDVVDLRPMPSTYPCVNYSFCYTNDSNGLQIDEIYRNRCICMAGYFSGADRECHLGREPPTSTGLFLAIIMYLIGILTFVAILAL